ncbi:MAG: T9SS type A sorting domain-containing protein, partial [Rhodothermales bacterium]|nr:T9SS type A sorting domain-containing protein [Rhodothermales bacterium]
YDLASLVSVEGTLPSATQGVRIDAAYPNPFSTTTSVSVTIATPGELRVEVFDLLGRVVDSVHPVTLTPGSHVLNWNRGGLPSGLYIMRVSTGAGATAERMVMAR